MSCVLHNTFNGSTPGDNMKKRGVVDVLSLNDVSSDGVRASTYFVPRFSSQKALNLNVILNYLIGFKKSI